MIFKRLFKSAYDHSLSLQERVFSVIPVIGLISMFVIVFISIIVQDDPITTAILVGGLIVFSVIVRVAVKKRRVQLGATIIAFAFTALVYFRTVIYRNDGRGSKKIYSSWIRSGNYGNFLLHSISLSRDGH